MAELKTLAAGLRRVGAWSALRFVRKLQE